MKRNELMALIATTILMFASPYVQDYSCLLQLIVSI